MRFFRKWTAVATAPWVVATAAYSQQPPDSAARAQSPASARSGLDQPALLNVRNVPLSVALDRLYLTSRASIFFSPSRLPRDLRTSCACTESTVREALEILLRNTAFTFREVDDGYILIVERPQPSTSTPGAAGGYAASLPRAGGESGSDRMEGAGKPDSATYLASGAITGVVTGRNGQPLVGARVAVSGSTNMVETAADGGFTIAGIPPGAATLRASFPGYAEARRLVTVTTDPAPRVKVSLTQLVVELEGVVAVGYGTAQRRDLTGSIASVDVERTAVGATATVGQLLQARVAGLQVTQNNGAPGGGIAVRLRGPSSISASSEPLYVIDGVPAFIPIRGNDANVNPLAAINPGDIESVEVLKDASSTAIYGARGAAGVILLTTKRGRRGENNFSLESSYGLQSPAKYLPMLDGPQFAAMIRDARANAGLPLVSPVSGEDYSVEEFGSIMAGGPGTDWQRLMLRTAPVQSHSMTFSGGDARTRFLVSGSVFEQRGILLGSDFKRYAGRVNFDRSISTALQVGTSLTLSIVDRNVQLTDNGLDSGAVTSALWFNPLVGPRLEDGSWRVVSPVTWPATNPLPGAIDDRNWETGYSAIGSVFAEAVLLDDVRIRSSLGLSANFERTEAYVRSTSPRGRSFNGRATVASGRTIGLTQENILTYERTAGPGNLGLTGGLIVQTSRAEVIEASNSRFANDLSGAWDLSAGTRPSATSDYRSWALLSYLGRATYALRDRYLFTVTGRADGSSRFGANNKWALFPSAAFAWRLIDEFFMRDQPLLDDLKLRVTYGVTGNQEIGLYQSLPRLMNVQATWGGVPVVGYATQSSAPNPDLRWETTHQYNLGLDYSLLSGRVSGTVDGYRSVTRDLLLAVALPASSGYSTRLANVGSVRNVGVEISLNTINYDGDHVGWTSSLTLAHNRNQVTDLGGAASLPVASQKGINGQTGSDVIKMVVGQPLGSFVGKQTQGLYQPGDPCPLRVLRPTIDCVAGEYRYVDTNGDGVIATTDEVILGNGQPDLHGGLANTVSVGKIEMNAFLQFAHGSEVLNASAINTKQVNTFANNTVDALRRWTPNNQDTDVPRANANRPREVYDVHIEDGSFVRLQSVTLGYSLPPRTLPGAATARVYARAENLALWTRYSGFDPEVNSFGGDATSPGVDAGAYPRPRTWTAGVQVTF